MSTQKLNGTVIVTYRCNARCSMCNRYKAPSKAEEEISIETIKKLPKMYFTNITGGEPFIRTDLKDVVRELYHGLLEMANAYPKEYVDGCPFTQDVVRRALKSEIIENYLKEE